MRRISEINECVFPPNSVAETFSLVVFVSSSFIARLLNIYARILAKTVLTYRAPMSNSSRTTRSGSVCKGGMPSGTWQKREKVDDGRKVGSKGSSENDDALLPCHGHNGFIRPMMQNNRRKVLSCR